MNRPPTHPSPPSHPSPYRYLGGGSGERPVRLQIVLALVAALVLAAVPLYLWRPQRESIPVADAAIADAGLADAAPAAPTPPPVVDAGPPPVELAPFQTIKCVAPGPGKTPPERCDRVMYFEDSLARAIRENVACAPQTTAGGTVSFVLDMDFRKKKLSLLAGKSGTIKGEKAKGLVRCVKRALPTPDWESIPHQYVKYQISVAATYAPSSIF
jgi:hypothetical protein